MPGVCQSAAYRVRAWTLSHASWRGSGRPTARRRSRSGGTAGLATRGPRRPAPPRGGARDRVDDLGVARAAAQIARDGAADLLARGRRMVSEEGVRGHDHPGDAEAALNAALGHERLLQGVEPVAVTQTAHGGDPAPGRAGRQHETAAHRLAVQEDRAGPADSLAAAFLHLHRPEVVSENFP